MKKLIISALLIVGIAANSGAAAPSRNARGGGSPAVPSAVAAPAAATTAARSAVRGASATPTSARSATTVAARSAARPVAARAGATQKVINSGTKIATAAKNTAVNEECQNKYLGCMDAFCMLDNTSGGRCICSDRNAELDTVLEEIEALDQQSYQMATLGVEQIEMGENAEAAIAKANAVADAQTALNISTKKSARKSLDLSMWNNVSDIDFEDEIFGETDTIQMSLDNKTGDALHRAAAEICIAQMPECGSDLSMLQLMYAQRIKSDCSAYENSLKQRKNESQNKLTAAQRALREAALEQYQAANKYDLGQCTIEFKKCMQRTAECGDDFSGCASVSAMDNTNVNKSTSKKAKMYSIKGAATTIEISASTYDTLLAKKPLCESVTKSCVAVADKVWDTFLKEVAPAVKSAELIAEDNARQNCISNISSCFQKACQDNIDPNDPEGSYDMCLTRPETMLNVCKIPLNKCGIDASSASAANQSQIWGFVLARLASMRVDSCSKEVKECLQSEDRCGSDYTQCVGLDTDTIVRMCPYDKLVGCQKKYGDVEIAGDDVYDELYRMVQGIFLNIDNNMLAKCQNAANEAMIAVCGDTENCDGLTVSEDVGTRSLEYDVCDYTSISGNNIEWGGTCYKSLDAVPNAGLDKPEGQGWAGKLSGVIYWGSIDYSCSVEGASAACELTPESDYVNNLAKAGNTISETDRNDIVNRVYGLEIKSLQNIINNAIANVESDPTVQFCMTGREVQGIRDSAGNMRTVGTRGGDSARFPQLTYQMRQIIASSVLKKARANYVKKYNSEVERMMVDQVAAAERIDEKITNEQKLAIAQNACDNWATTSELPKSEAPKVSNVGKIIAAVVIAAATITAVVLSAGTLAPAIASAATAAGQAVVLGTAGTLGTTAAGALGSATVAAITAAPVVVGVAGAAGTAALSASAAQEAQENAKRAGVDQWNYKETITTMFNPVTGVCTKIRVSQNCEKTKKNYCDKWAEPEETREEVTLL